MMYDSMRNQSILVVMPLYNAVNYVEKAVDSIFSQTYPDYQLLVLDDGSSDGSSEIIAKYVGDKITLLHQSHSGPGVAMNRAVQYAHERQIPFIARMDADDISMPMRLEIQHELLQENPTAAACSSNCYYVDSETDEIVGTSTVSRRSSFIKWEIQSGLRGLIQGATLFRTIALIEVGGYRPHFRYAEETDLFLRLAEKFELVNAKEYLYKIRMNTNSLSMRDASKNSLYHFYALECSRNRRASKPEDDFRTFLGRLDWKLSVRIWHYEFMLKLWRSNIVRRNYMLLLLASLIDPRRTIARILRKI
jgi:glycosyltransferase involved in cell wall biosynthesis